MAEPITISIDDRTVPATTGQSIAAALITAGITSGGPPGGKGGRVACSAASAPASTA